MIEGKYFTLEADDTMHDSNAEFVVHGPRPQKWGFSFYQKKQLVNTMHEVVELAQKIDARGKVPFQATELDPRANEEVIIHNTGNEPYIVQATAGIRLDQLANVMRRVGKGQKEEPEERERKGRKDG